jgi:hypothetical protein
MFHGLYEESTNSVVQTEVGIVTNLVRKTVGFPAGIHQQIDNLARSRGVSRAAIIRSALEEFIRRAGQADGPLSDTADIASSISRMALTTEFSQATLDILLRDRSPSDRDEVLLTVQQRMEKFHGKK